jgi:hypothetical protein
MVSGRQARAKALGEGVSDMTNEERIEGEYGFYAVLYRYGDNTVQVCYYGPGVTVEET